MRQRESDTIAAVFGVFALLTVSCVIFYSLGYHAAKAASMPVSSGPIYRVASCSIAAPGPSDMDIAFQARDARVAAELQRQQEEAGKHTVVQQCAVFTPDEQSEIVNGAYEPDVERWRGLVAQVLQEQGVYAPRAVEEFLQVMTGESHGHPESINPGGPCGLMQCSADAFWTVDRLLDPYQNLTCAAIQYRASGWTAWECKPW